MRIFKTAFFLFLLGAVLQSQAQIWPNIKEDTKDFLGTRKDLSGAVFSNDKQAYKNATLISAGVISFSLLDKSVRSFTRKHKSSLGSTVFSIDDYYGDKWYMTGSIAAVH